MTSPLGYMALYAVVIWGLCSEWAQARGVDRVVIGAAVCTLVGAYGIGVVTASVR